MDEDSPAPTSTFNTLFWAPWHMKLSGHFWERMASRDMFIWFPPHPSPTYEAHNSGMIMCGL